ncbi:tryptophan transporter [Priestia koreensis]|uniref:Tryptophan transporter n=1 Tax=Priestia koreensis TaxID=284581 RepID=A0A0M0LGJ9_9BACI|nr:tryptophan transporter [Priestia koreensis]KOO50215.1 tryptophan transporter [Priestia koreensis]
MRAKELVTLSLLVGIGAVLHSIMPPLLLGMKPDLLLTMMFVGILLFPNAKSVLLVGITTGIISALTTSFPGGQVANVIEKPITAFVFLAMVVAVRKMRNSVVKASILTAIGTIISGGLFLGTALAFAGLPGGFMALILAVVLPTAVVNVIVMIVIYPIVTSIVKRTKMVTTAM